MAKLGFHFVTKRLALTTIASLGASVVVLLTASAAGATEVHREYVRLDEINDPTRVDDCFTKGTTPHVCVLMRLSQFESAYETDLDR